MPPTSAARLREMARVVQEEASKYKLYNCNQRFDYLTADAAALLAGAEAIECLKDIMDSLPRNRDWLDPVTEKRARDVCAEMDRLLPQEPNR